MNSMIFDGDVSGWKDLKIVDDAVYVVEQYGLGENEDIRDVSKAAMDDSIKFLDSAAGKRLVKKLKTEQKWWKTGAEKKDEEVEAALKELYGNE